MPSPVHDQPVGGRLVALAGAAEARITFLALKTSISPVRMSRATQPMQLPSSSWQQRGGEPLLVAVHGLVVLHELLVEHVQDRLAGDVGDVGGALHRGAAERAQVQLAVLVAVEGDADVLEVHDLAGGLRAHDLDRVLVAEEVRALDGVVGVRAPVVGRVDRGVDAARGGHRVRAHGVDLAHDRDGGAGLGGGQGGSLAGESGADDQVRRVQASGGDSISRARGSQDPARGGRRSAPAHLLRA